MKKLISHRVYITPASKTGGVNPHWPAGLGVHRLTQLRIKLFTLGGSSSEDGENCIYYCHKTYWVMIVVVTKSYQSPWKSTSNWATRASVGVPTRGTGSSRVIAIIHQKQQFCLFSAAIFKT